jgi:hypothetical protein
LRFAFYIDVAPSHEENPLSKDPSKDQWRDLDRKGEYGIDPAVIQQIAREIKEVKALGVEIAIVIGVGISFGGLQRVQRGWTELLRIRWGCWPRS